LGIERDNDSGSRHAELLTAAKVPAPSAPILSCQLGDGQNIYQNGFFTVKLGPFLDSGAVADSQVFSARSVGSGIPARNAKSDFWKSDYRSVLRKRLAGRTKRLLWYRLALILAELLRSF